MPRCVIIWVNRCIFTQFSHLHAPYTWSACLLLPSNLKNPNPKLDGNWTPWKHRFRRNLCFQGVQFPSKPETRKILIRVWNRAVKRGCKKPRFFRFKKTLKTWKVQILGFFHVFSERELKFTFAICRRPSVCLSSVCNVRAPYSDDWNFRQCFYAIWYLGHPWPLGKNFTEIVPGEPLGRGS